MSHVKNTTLVRVGLLENKCLRKSDFNNVRIINMSPPPYMCMFFVAAAALLTFGMCVL